MPCIRVGGSIVCVPRIVEYPYNGRVWRWEMHSFNGPTPIRADGSMWKRIPSERHPFWKAFQEWWAKNMKQEPVLSEGT
jgi:hypothetical protein